MHASLQHIETRVGLIEGDGLEFRGLGFSVEGLGSGQEIDDVVS